ncbi:MAG TPA: hypothetical protein VGL94_00680 [Ktedonobacteraceae bacterium]|jgi:hypothetical protein
MDHNKPHHELQTHTAHHEVKETISQDKRELSGPLSLKHLMTEIPEKPASTIFSKDQKKLGTSLEHPDDHFDTSHDRNSDKKSLGTNEHLNDHFDTADDTKNLDTNEHLNDHFDTTKFGTTFEYFEASHEKRPGTTHENIDTHFDIYNDKNGLINKNELNDPNTDKKKQRSLEILTTKASETDSNQYNKELTTTHDEHKDEKDFVSSTRHLGEAADRNYSSDPSDASFGPSDVNKGNQKNTFLGMLKEQLSYTNLFPDMSPQDNGTNNHEAENTHHQPHSAEVLNEVLPNHEEAVDNHNATHEDEIPPTYEKALEDASPPYEEVANNHEVPNEPPPSKEVIHNDEDPHDTTPSHERTVNPHEVKTDAPPAHEQAVRDNNLSSRRETDKRHTNNSTSKVVSIKAGNKDRGR